MEKRQKDIHQAASDKYIHDLKKRGAFVAGANWADKHPKCPWIMDRDPEIKGSISDAVLLLIDGMFYRVSRLERRKDGSEFWWGVDVANGEEVTAWMPIPQEPENN